jgi:hypothetical protein
MTRAMSADIATTGAATIRPEDRLPEELDTIASAGGRDGHDLPALSPTRKGGAEGEGGRAAVDDANVDFHPVAGGDPELDTGGARPKSSAGDGDAGRLKQLRPPDRGSGSQKSWRPS